MYSNVFGSAMDVCKSVLSQWVPPLTATKLQVFVFCQPRVYRFTYFDYSLPCRIIFFSCYKEVLITLRILTEYVNEVFMLRFAEVELRFLIQHFDSAAI